jgi:Phospholipid methyltransferase
VPKADQGTGLVTTGPYRLVRHPIYLGLALLAMGEALAFGSWPALMIVAVWGCPDHRLARPRGGETAQPHIWQALRRLPTANQDDHPAPPSRDRWNFDAFVEFGLSVIVSGLDIRSRDAARS